MYASRVSSRTEFARIALAEYCSQGLRQRFVVVPHALAERIHRRRLASIEAHAFDTAHAQFITVHGRRALPLEINQVRHVTRPKERLRVAQKASTLLARPCDGGDKILRRKSASFAVETPIQDENFEPRPGSVRSRGSSNSIADTAQNERWRQ